MPFVGVGFVFLGFLVRRNADAVSGFFRSQGERLYGERAAARIYTARGIRWAGGGWIAFGILFTALMIGQLIAKIAYSA